MRIINFEYLKKLLWIVAKMFEVSLELMEWQVVL